MKSECTRRPPVWAGLFRNGSMILLVAVQVLLAGGKLRVVASVPDLGDMARRIGGDLVEVTVLATGREDLHSVPARPSFLPILNRADLLLVLGLDAEHAWLHALVNESRNARIREGGPGWIDCSQGIPILGRPEKLDRSEGEQHPLGNPHYNIGPQSGRVMAGNIAKAFMAADQQNASTFQRALESYTEELVREETSLRERGASLKGITIVEYHPDITYLAEFYGLKIVGSIEPKAGVPPTAAHLRHLGDRARRDGVRMVVYNQSQNPRVAQRFAAQIGISAVEIANAVGAKKEITTWVQLQQYNLDRLLSAMDGEAK